MVCIPPSLSLFVSNYNKHSIIRKGTAPKAMQEKGCIHRLAPRFAQSPLGCPEGAVHSLRVITRVLGKLHRGGGVQQICKRGFAWALLAGRTHTPAVARRVRSVLGCSSVRRLQGERAGEKKKGKITFFKIYENISSDAEMFLSPSMRPKGQL